MRRDFDKKRMSHSQNKRLKIIGLLMFFVVVLMIVVVSRYKLFDPSNWVASSSQYVKTWVSENNKYLKKDSSPVKSIDNNKPDIHFEFYSTLPNAKITVAESQVEKTKSDIFSAEKLQRSLQNELNKHAELKNKKGRRNHDL